MPNAALCQVSIMLSVVFSYCYDECHYDVCVSMLSAIMLSVVVQSGALTYGFDGPGLPMGRKILLTLSSLLIDQGNLTYVVRSVQLTSLL